MICSLEGYNDDENLASRNSPSFAVDLNCGTGSSPLKADVNALDRLQIVVAGIHRTWARSRGHARCGPAVLELRVSPRRMPRR